MLGGVFAQEIPRANLVEEANLLEKPEEQSYIYALDAYAYASRQQGEFYKKREYGLAGKLFFRYLEKFPNHKNAKGARYYLGVCYVKIGRLKEARIEFDKIIKKYKQGEFVVKAAKYMAYDSEFSKNYKRAQSYYKVVAEKSEGGVEQYEAKFNLGLCALKIDRKNEAISYFKAAVKDIPRTSIYYQQSLHKLAHLQREKGLVEDSLKTFTLLAQEGVTPKLRSEGTFFMGLSLYQQGKFKEADEAYKKVLAMDDLEWKPQALISVMSVKYAEGDYKGVIRDSISPGVILPADLRARKDILGGQSYLKMKEYREAIQSFNQVIKGYPNTGESFEAGYRKILCYYNLKSGLVSDQVNQFIEKYGRTYGDHTFMHKALLLQAETFFEEKSYEAAAKVYRQIDVEKVGEGNELSVYYKRAWCYHELGRHRDAIDSFTRFLSRYPDDPRKLQILNIRANNYAKLENRKEAIADLEEVIKLSPETLLAASATQSAARLYKEEEEFEKMISKYQDLLSKFEDLEKPVLANASYWCGWGFFKLEKFKEALPYLNKAKTMDAGAYVKKIALLEVLSNYQLKDKPAMVVALKAAIEQGVGNDIPMGIYRWVGSQCFKAGEFSDAQIFFKHGRNKIISRGNSCSLLEVISSCAV